MFSKNKLIRADRTRKFKEGFKKTYPGIASAVTLVAVAMPTVFASGAAGSAGNSFFESAIDILKIILILIGAGLAVWGVVNLLEGYGNDNPGAKSQGMKQLMAGAGIILIGIILVPLLYNVFTNSQTDLK